MNAEEADEQIAARWKAAKEHHSGPEFGNALEAALLKLVSAELSRGSPVEAAIDRSLRAIAEASLRLDQIKEIRDRL